ncbi:MAG: chromosomal replication initiator protein DnaA [Xanthobacteraceae bacterium]|jgi:chromosomal replication initiator protein|nr:chromosomal replication initiator protein DnaA [Xanthobacteraceae bacterium]
MNVPKKNPEAAADERETPAARWERIRKKLRAELGEETYMSWFASLQLVDCDGRLSRLSVPTRFLKSWIEEHHFQRLKDHWQTELPGIEKVELVVRTAVMRSQVAGEKAEGVAIANPEADRFGKRGILRATGNVRADGPGGSPLDPRMTFTTFIVGKQNGLAHAAAKQIVEAGTNANGTPRFNPLYVHASVGLGKTHLLQAIAHAYDAQGKRAVYLTAEKFMYGFVAALKNQSAIAFKEALRGIDALIIDDLQFLQGRAVQQEFCHTLNALTDAGRQVVVAADRPPVELENLEDRVRSRLGGGLTVEVGPMDEELRLNILMARAALLKAEDARFDVPMPVLAHIASQVTQSGRDLEAAVTRLLHHSQFYKKAVTTELADEVIRDLVRPTDPRRIRVEDILRVVSKHYGVTRADLLSSRRTANVVRPRQIAMYLAKVLTLRSLPEIGRRFGGRDHTTVLHAVRKIEGLVQGDKALAEEIEVLKRMLME